MLERRSLSRRSLPTRRTWLKSLTHTLGRPAALSFLDRVELTWAQLLAHSSPYHPRVLQKLHFEQNLLPVLAAYITLLDDGTPSAEALRQLDLLLESGAAGQKRIYRFLGKFPFFFDLLKLTLEPLTRLQYPSRGWCINFPRLGPDVIALDSYSCFYLDVLKEYALPQLTCHFCHLDDYLFDGVTSYIKFERTGTLGRGADHCDFRYYRLRPFSR